MVKNLFKKKSKEYKGIPGPSTVQECQKKAQELWFIIGRYQYNIHVLNRDITHLEGLIKGLHKELDALEGLTRELSSKAKEEANKAIQEGLAKQEGASDAEASIPSDSSSN